MTLWARRLRRAVVKLLWTLEVLYAAVRDRGTWADPILMDAEYQTWIAHQQERAL